MTWALSTYPSGARATGQHRKRCSACERKRVLAEVRARGSFAEVRADRRALVSSPKSAASGQSLGGNPTNVDQHVTLAGYRLCDRRRRFGAMGARPTKSLERCAAYHGLRPVYTAIPRISGSQTCCSDGGRPVCFRKFSARRTGSAWP